MMHGQTKIKITFVVLVGKIKGSIFSLCKNFAFRMCKIMEARIHAFFASAVDVCGRDSFYTHL